MSDTEYLESSSLIIQAVDRMMMNQDLSWTKEHKEHMPPDAFRNYFQTVRVALPRRSGHTYAAQELWRKYNTIIVMPKHDWIINFLREIRVVNRNDFSSHGCFAANSSDAPERFGKQLISLMGLPEHKQPELLIFDGASMLRYAEPKEPWFEVHEKLWSVWNEGHVCFKDIDTFVEEQCKRSFDWTDIVDQITTHAMARLPSIRGVAILQ